MSKRITLHDTHVKLGAKILPFAGYEMPILYNNLIQEHLAVRQNMGVFDVSHMGEFILKGPKAIDLIQKLCTNDASVLTDGKVQYTCMTNNEGGIVDDLLVYRWNQNEYYLVVNASNIDKDWDWITSHNTEGVEMENISDRLSLFAVQGPNAVALVQQLTNLDISALDNYEFLAGTVAGIQDVIISTTGYTGAGGVEIYVWNTHAQQMWDKLFEIGEPMGLVPVGLGARDTLRTEMGYCLYGHDIDDKTSPIEAGLGWITKFNKTFTMSEHHLAIKTNKPTQKLVGIELIERGIPRQYYPILNEKGHKIGQVTSGTQSPSLGKGIGMAYIKTEYAIQGQEIFVEIRTNKVRAKVVKMPFN